MTIGEGATRVTASPYSTGGGGTVLEHRYGAVLLAHLLTGDPVPLLGDDVAPLSVRFQASAFSPVDDLLVVGQTPGGERRIASIGVRRAPLLVGRDAASARLLATYLRVLTDQWEDVRAGRWRLGLAVASPNTAVQQLRELSVIARDTPEEAGFRAAVGLPGRTNQGVRDRLGHVDRLVGVGATEAEIGSGVGASELTWRLLSNLQVTELRLEGADETDRTLAVGRLRVATRDGTTAAADTLFSRLVELAGRYAPAGAEVTESALRRDLSGVPLARSISYAKAWTILDGLATRLRDRTGSRLADPSGDLEVEVERAETREALVAELKAAATGAATLVVLGEPDVGKSALTLRATEQLDASGVAVTSFGLRDLPATALEFENLLGRQLVDVFGATATGSGRLLLIDGAESVLEGRGPLLIDIAVGALRGGLGVVAVTRRDGARAVAEALGRAGAAVGGRRSPREHEVPGLTPTETEQLSATFPSLVRLANEPRASWLLARPGLVDLLLRAGAVLHLPSGPLSEAELFAAIWHYLVRRAEASVPGGPSPDARDRSLTRVARRLLSGDPGEPPDADALPSLRSDGLLIPPGPTSAWNPSDQFASDLVRDLAVARLLITNGWELLDQSGAPRWALRAVRLACQSTLAAAGDTFEGVWVSLQATFDSLADKHGARWAEVPLEAMLTLGSARDALMQAWPRLLDDDQSGLRTLLRLALQRHTVHGFGDPIVLAPLVDLAYCGNEDLGQDNRYARRGPGEQIRELVLAWLRGLAKSSPGSNLLRQRVRDRLLATQPEPYDEFAVEALAMVGTDLDQHTEAFLRKLASDRAGHLAPAVESIGPIVALSNHQPELLITLAEAFYIERRSEDEHGWSMLDDGIRHHLQTGGFGVPMAAWYFGPFFRLLNARPVEALAMINRMLDHAAVARVHHIRSLEDDANRSTQTLPGLDLDLPGVGARRCVGDSHVWYWYRGSSVGPYPCMSALLAVERFADYLVDVLQLPLARVAGLLLRDCHNLAMPGLVTGLLVRHLDRAEDLLDRWLVQPELWQLEFARAVAEGQLHVQGRDGAEVFGQERRRYSFREVAANMTLRAMAAGDEARLATLSAIGDELVERARSLISGAEGQTDEIATVEGWAATFRPENYQTERTNDGRVIVQYEHPEEVAAALAPNLAQLARGTDAMRLQLAYGRSEDRVASVETLIDDVVLARGLAQDPPAQGALRLDDAIAAVASAAVVAHTQGRATVSGSDLRWAADVLVDAAMRPQVDETSYAATAYQMGADRSAAAALPSLLLPPFDSIGLDLPRVEEALRCCATSVFDEVRGALALGVRPVWASPCGKLEGSGVCRHEAAWNAIQEGLRDCQLGDWNAEAQRRLPEPLGGPYDRTLPAVATERLLVNRLTGPLLVAADAARSDSCVRDAARCLVEVLYDAHRRGSDHWARKGYGDFNDRQRPRVTRALVEAAIAGDSGPLAEYVRFFTSNARALDQLLRDLVVLFTYDEALRPALSTVWREVMSVALGEIERGADLLNDRHWSDSAVADLLPTPQLDVSDDDPDATLERARQGWVTPDEIADLVARWLLIARHQPKAVDSVVQLARCASPAWQASAGLIWVEDLIDGDYGAVAGSCWFLVDWLEALRSSSSLDAEGTVRWRRIVDGLVERGDNRAVRLQQTEE